MKNRDNIVKEIISWVWCIGSGAILALFFNHAVLVNAQVISPSMETTIMTDDRIIGFRLAYVLHEPERFDIIVFKFPDDETSDPFVKRIIGLPGEQVDIRGGKVYINGAEEPLDDSFINEEDKGDYGPFYVPEGSYFVMGDNRSNSWDSKDWTNTYVSRDKILGKILAEWYPKLKLLDRHEK